MKQVTGASSVPRVFIGGQCIGGGDETSQAHRSIIIIISSIIIIIIIFIIIIIIIIRLFFLRLIFLRLIIIRPIIIRLTIISIIIIRLIMGLIITRLMLWTADNTNPGPRNINRMCVAYHLSCRRPYHVECTGSLLTSEVKRHRARLVLGWGTAWEDLRVLSAFALAGPEFFDRCVFGVCSVCWGKGVAGWVAGAKCSPGSFLVFALMHVDGSPWSS